MTEQLALQKLGRQRSAVDGDEGMRGARAVVVDRQRRELLAGSAVAAYQDRRVGRRDPRDRLEHARHGLAGAHHVVVQRDQLEPLALPFEPGKAPSILDRGRGDAGNPRHNSQVLLLEADLRVARIQVQDAERLLAAQQRNAQAGGARALRLAVPRVPARLQIPAQQPQPFGERAVEDGAAHVQQLRRTIPIHGQSRGDLMAIGADEQDACPARGDHLQGRPQHLGLDSFDTPEPGQPRAHFQQRAQQRQSPQVAQRFGWGVEGVGRRRDLDAGPRPALLPAPPHPAPLPRRLRGHEPEARAAEREEVALAQRLLADRHPVDKRAAPGTRGRDPKAVVSLAHDAVMREHRDVRNLDAVRRVPAKAGLALSQLERAAVEWASDGDQPRAHHSKLTASGGGAPGADGRQTVCQLLLSSIAHTGFGRHQPRRSVRRLPSGIDGLR